MREGWWMAAFGARLTGVERSVTSCGPGPLGHASAAIGLTPPGMCQPLTRSGQAEAVSQGERKPWPTPPGDDAAGRRGPPR